MITLLGAFILLIIGYFVYSKVVEKVFGIDDSKKTPAYTEQDGMDYVPLSSWKGSLIQLINIAGTGPIFGALMGALYGPVAFIWIVVGSIFAGAVHDYFSGMLSVKHKGEQFPSIVGRYLGNGVKAFVNVLSIVLMILVAAAFTASPAQLISSISPISFTMALLLVFCYFILVAVLPINKIIAKIYPLLGVILIFMAAAIAVALMFDGKAIPNITLENLHPGELPIWPLLMVTITCGAISGFHATQSPIVAKTLQKESDGRKVFYGAMIGEGAIALIWAAAGMTFFGGTAGLQDALALGGPAGVVNDISTSLLGTMGGVLAIICVILLPVTTGDTALRSSRMLLSDMLSRFLKFEGKAKIFLVTGIVSVPTFLLATIDYSFLWRYVGWTNQLSATIMLWTATVFLLNHRKFHWICGLPAIFMTGVAGTYIFYAPEGFQLSYGISLVIGTIITIIVIIWYIRKIIQAHKLKNTPTIKAA
ncbi:carbon starvation CstA family protein [Cytobacillus purgationiresistens]|uniref:Carbon starvation protein CstA n=1 Tax=Cytobacillus purgationiresistens TaxID=863449 RepID=A0ABU0ABL5_9BACI|nr:carbon starvation CstA family protein [Cytobacillus purgationiresistens]MDQ0268646.1 carbon starvation protein CstA [Cytobacillus purgationiresistens]